MVGMPLSLKLSLVVSFLPLAVQGGLPHAGAPVHSHGVRGRCAGRLFAFHAHALPFARPTTYHLHGLSSSMCMACHLHAPLPTTCMA